MSVLRKTGKEMMRKNLIIALLMLVTCQLGAQDTEITVDAPESVGTGVGFRIIYTINSAEGKFQPPEFGDSFSVNGPQMSSSRGRKWVNGKFSSSSTSTYVYYLVAEKEGDYTIPPASYVIRDKTVNSSSVNISVSGSGASPSSAGTTTRTNRQNSSKGEEVYLRLIPHTKDVYVGQPVEVSVKLHTRIQIGNPGTGVYYPDLKGFLKETIKVPPLQNLELETINGVEYGTGLVDKFLLYPQISGDLVIDRAQMQVLVEQRTEVDDFFAGTPFSSSVTVPRTLSTLPVTIHVKPLPAPRPSDFYGAVGRFEITSSISKESIQVNDAITLSITISGSGNINTAGPPVFETPATVEKYDPKVTVNASGIAGIKTFEFLLIPRHTGEFIIPEVRYSYFDISSGRYVTLKTQPYKINVTQGSGGAEAGVPVIAATKEEVKYLGQDIRFIRTNDKKLTMKGNAMVESFSYFMTYLLSLLIAAFLFLLLRQYRQRNADINLSRNRKAAQAAKKRLKKAEENLKTRKFDIMHEEIAKALWGYLSDKLLIPLSDLTRDRCFASLKEKSVTQDTISELDSILTACEYSRFAPSSASDSPESLYLRSEKLLSVLENLL